MIEKQSQKRNLAADFFGDPEDALAKNILVLADNGDLRLAIESWLEREIAHGDARQDTLDNYRYQMGLWFTWCQKNWLNPAEVTKQDVESYRRELIEAGREASTIAVKLTVIRQFYHSALSRGLIRSNPAAQVHPPLERKLRDKKKKNLNQAQSEKLLDTLPSDDSVRSLRDRAIIALALLEGLRRVEIHRANVEEIETIEYQAVGSNMVQKIQMLIHGKRKDRRIYPRQDTVDVVHEYLAVRGPVAREELAFNHERKMVTPLFCAISTGGRSVRRLSRRGINFIIDGYLERAGLKEEQISCHALRHSCGYLTYKETKDIRAIQDVLGHADINTSAIYAESDHEAERYTERIPLSARRKA